MTVGCPLAVWQLNRTSLNWELAGAGLVEVELGVVELGVVELGVVERGVVELWETL
jgi:hypothetical protein